MSQNSHPVPRLDLAPNLSRPFSLWKPLDYLRLLYWVFFFPQALQSYIDTFGGNGFKEAKTWQERWAWLRQNPIQLQLILQALTLIVILPILGDRILEQVGFAVNWWGVALGVAWGVWSGVSSGVRSGVACGVVSGVACGVVSGVACSLTSGVALGVVLGVALDIALSMAVGMALGMAFALVCGVAFALVYGVAFALVYGVVYGVQLGVVYGVVWGVALGVACTRPENWLLALPFALLKPRNQNRYFPHVTPLPLPYLSSQVANWLRQDWETGKHNINQLLRFTLQFIPVVQAVNRVLAETPPELLIYRVAQLADEFYDRTLLPLASASLNKSLKLETLRGLFFMIEFLPEPWQQRFKDRFELKMRLDTPARAAAAGFWYLDVQKPEKATEAFAVVRHLPYGEEMFTLAQILTVLDQARTPSQFATLNLPASPNQPFLHLPSWEAIAALRRVISDVKIVQQSASKSAASSLALNRALGEIEDILDELNNIPPTERILITKIAMFLKIGLSMEYE